MKIAVLVCGMYREFDIAVKSWNFIHELECDVYFSTWNKSKQKNSKLGIVVDEDINEDRIKNHIPNATISILNDENYNHLRNPEKLIFHWKRCLEMIENNQVKYDMIILTRPDNYTIFGMGSDEILKYNKKDRIYGLEEIKNEGYGMFIQDIFFMGDYEIMSNLIKTIPNKFNTNEAGGSIHYHLSKHVIDCNLIVEPIDRLYVVTVRANSRELKEITLNSIFEKTMIWGDNQIQYNENNT